MIPKILVFTPIYDAKDYCLDAFVENCSKFNYPNYEHIIIDNSKTKKYYYDLQGKLHDTGIKVYHVTRGNNSRESLARAQNFARRYFLEGDYDYLMSLESDIFAPSDTLQRLLLHNKKVVTGWYLIGTKEVKIPCITIKKFNEHLHAWGTRLLNAQEILEYTRHGLKEVAAGGMGVCLIKRGIVERFKFYYDPRFTGHSDIYFFNDCNNNKVKVYVDTDLTCDHQFSNWMEVQDR